MYAQTILTACLFAGLSIAAPTPNPKSLVNLAVPVVAANGLNVLDNVAKREELVNAAVPVVAANGLN
ncbi:hypothetical protein LTS12_025585, partial [Elasticomyces elasticus]